MKPALNRKVYVVGYDVVTPLGNDWPSTWRRAVGGEAGFRRVTRCETTSRSNVVGEIPDWNPGRLILSTAKSSIIGMPILCF